MKIKFLISEVKYYPIVINIYILTLMILYVLDIPVNLNRFLYIPLGHGLYANLIIFGMSKMFRFCVWHRLLLINMSACLMLEGLRQYNFNINNLPYIVIISTIISIFIAIIILRKYGTYSKKKFDNSI